MSPERCPNPQANIYARTLLSSLIRPEKVALWHWREGAPAMEATTFAGLIDQTHRVAALLRKWEIGPGDRVLVLVPMSPELYAIILGIAQVGAVAVFLDLWVGKAPINAACAAAAPKAFFGVPKAHLLRVLLPAFRRIRHAHVVDSGWMGLTLRRRLARVVPDATVAAVDPGDAAVIAYTTGSTGQPKPVRRTHGYLAAMLEALNQHESKGVDEVDMPAWPILLFDGLCHGRTSVIPKFQPGKVAEADPATLMRQVHAAGVTLLVGPPALYERLCDYLESKGESFPLRFAFLGGAVVAPSLLRRVQALMPRGKAFAVYGSTEVEPVASVSAAEMESLPEGLGVCVGHLHPALSLKVLRHVDGPITLDERGWDPWEQRPCEPGEIAVSGPHVSVDYLEAPDAWALNKIRGPDGRIWHRMGDSGYVDESGRLWLLGRTSHALETPSGTLFPVPCERQALRVPGVQRAVLLGMGNEAWIVVVPAPGVDAETLCRDVVQGMQPLPIARVVAQPSLPLDPRHNTKVDIEALRRQLQGSIRLPRNPTGAG